MSYLIYRFILIFRRPKFWLSMLLYIFTSISIMLPELILLLKSASQVSAFYFWLIPYTHSQVSRLILITLIVACLLSWWEEEIHSGFQQFLLKYQTVSNYLVKNFMLMIALLFIFLMFSYIFQFLIMGLIFKAPLYSMTRSTDSFRSYVGYNLFTRESYFSFYLYQFFQLFSSCAFYLFFSMWIVTFSRKKLWGWMTTLIINTVMDLLKSIGILPNIINPNFLYNTMSFFRVKSSDNYSVSEPSELLYYRLGFLFTFLLVFYFMILRVLCSNERERAS